MGPLRFLVIFPWQLKWISKMSCLAAGVSMAMEAPNSWMVSKVYKGKSENKMNDDWEFPHFQETSTCFFTSPQNCGVLFVFLLR